jgi:hypothetical protein
MAVDMRSVALGEAQVRPCRNAVGVPHRFQACARKNALVREATKGRGAACGARAAATLRNGALKKSASRYLQSSGSMQIRTWANENCGSRPACLQFAQGCSDASKGGSSLGSLSLRVAPVPLRAFDPPSAPSDPGRRSAPRNGPFCLTKEC